MVVMLFLSQHGKLLKTMMLSFKTLVEDKRGVFFIDKCIVFQSEAALCILG